jgi:hypothetical protein
MRGKQGLQLGGVSALVGDDDGVGGRPISNIVWRGMVRAGQRSEDIVTVLDGITVTTGERHLEAGDSLASLCQVRRMGSQRQGTYDHRPSPGRWKGSSRQPWRTEYKGQARRAERRSWRRPGEVQRWLRERRGERGWVEAWVSERGGIPGGATRNCTYRTRRRRRCQCLGNPSNRHQHLSFPCRTCPPPAPKKPAESNPTLNSPQTSHSPLREEPAHAYTSLACNGMSSPHIPCSSSPTSKPNTQNTLRRRKARVP